MRYFSRSEMDQIINNMSESEDSFVRQLARLLIYSNEDQKKVLSIAFPELFREYLTKIAKVVKS